MKLPSPQRTLLPLALLGAVACSSGKKDPNAIDPNDTEAVNARMVEIATPDEHHAHLEVLVGQFRCESTLWMAPGAEPEKSVGTSTHRWVLGGRFVEQVFNGTFMGQPFEGQGLIGYDKVREAYVGSWVDNFTTQMWDVSTGQYDMETHSLTMTREVIDPITGEKGVARDVTTFTDDRHFAFDMYMPGPDGEEFHSLHIDYTRR